MSPLIERIPSEQLGRRSLGNSRCSAPPRAEGQIDRGAAVRRPRAVGFSAAAAVDHTERQLVPSGARRDDCSPELGIAAQAADASKVLGSLPQHVGIRSRPRAADAGDRACDVVGTASARPARRCLGVVSAVEGEQADTGQQVAEESVRILVTQRCGDGQGLSSPVADHQGADTLGHRGRALATRRDGRHHVSDHDLVGPATAGTASTARRRSRPRRRPSPPRSSRQWTMRSTPPPARGGPGQRPPPDRF